MIIIEEIHSLQTALAEYPDFLQDTLTLGWEERRKMHSKHTTDQGVPFAISLPLGSRIEKGQCLVAKEKKLLISVEEAVENVVILSPQTSQEFAYLAYQIGNRHQALMITETELICLAEHAVMHLLSQLDIPYTKGQRSFSGVLHGI